MKGLKGISAVIATILMLVITIALAGTAYMYMTNIFGQQTQGIEVLDSFCDSSGSVTMSIRNIGTNPVTSITCLQTAPAADTTCSPGFTSVSIQPGATQQFTSMDTCTGSGARFCQYRLTPNTGRTITPQASCS